MALRMVSPVKSAIFTVSVWQRSTAKAGVESRRSSSSSSSSASFFSGMSRSESLTSRLENGNSSAVVKTLNAVCTRAMSAALAVSVRKGMEMNAFAR